MKKKGRVPDPYAAREADKYDNPIPSREYILEFLRTSIGPLTHEELCGEFELHDADPVEALRRRLAAMERDGQVVKNRRGAYGTLDKMNLIKGRVVGHPDGFGFVVPGGGEPDIFLSSRQMRRVFDSDEVLVRIAGEDSRGRLEGSIVEVVEHRTEQLVGRYFVESGIHFVRPDNPRIGQDIQIAAGDANNAERGQIVLVAITRQPSRQNQPAGRVVRVLGEHLAPGMEIETAIYNFGIPNTWSAEITAELEAIADEVQPADREFRVDLRALPLVTIDGEDARDFDDAVYCEPVRGGGWRLLVAIADVAHYVRPGSALDSEALRRGNSVYFPGQVVPMLPEKLSNGLCSLKPEVERLCMVCEARIDKTGTVTSFMFYEGVMYSRARLTYTQVAGMLAQRDDSDSTIRQQFRAVVPHIDHLHDLYRVLLAARQRRGAIDFETGDTRILFDAQRKIEQIIPSERTEAHRLIEECMLCANVCAAQLLLKSQLPALYRVHDGPRAEKLAALREFLGELGLGLPGGDDPTPADYQAVLKKVADRPDAPIIQSVMLRSMTQAVYAPDNIGHFGLHYEAYTHFTSPIRRYPDLLVHRAIRGLLRSKGRSAHLQRVRGAPQQELRHNYPYDSADITAAGQQCSVTERRADDATRTVVNWLKCEYLLDRVGDEFAGVVTSVTGFGLFVELEDLYIDGLVHITGLPKDYYVHEPAHHRLVGERTRRVFRLGDRLKVRVTRVDLDERKIDFDLVEGAGKSRRGKTGHKADEGKPQHSGGARTAQEKRSGRGKNKPRSRAKKVAAESKTKTGAAIQPVSDSARRKGGSAGSDGSEKKQQAARDKGKNKSAQTGRTRKRR